VAFELIVVAHVGDHGTAFRERYRLAEEASIVVSFADGTQNAISGDTIDGLMPIFDKRAL
jgi:hypothetical protein